MLNSVSPSFAAARAFRRWTSPVDSQLLDRDHLVVCLLGSAAIVAFGLIHEVVDPLAWDPWWLRGSLAAAGLALPVVYRWSAVVRLNFRLLFQILLYINTLWVVLICTVNGFPASYSSTLIFTVVATITVLSLSSTFARLPLTYLVFTLALVGFGLATLTDSGPEHVLYLMSAAGSGTAVYVMAARRIMAQGALENSEQQFRAAAEFFEEALSRLPLEVAILDVHARYLYVNPAAVGDQSVRDWMVGKTSLEYAMMRGLNPEIFRRRYEWILEVVHTKTESRLEETVTGTTGKTKTVLRVASPVLDRKGEVVQVFAYGIDLTDRKVFEEQLMEAKNHAEEMLRLKSAFLSNMSHEIRTPLTGILGFANVLAEEATGETKEFATGIARGAARLHETLESVLDLARLESGRYLLTPTPVDVVAEVNDTVRLHSLSAQEKGLFLKVKHDRPFAIAKGDPACLHRILNNLAGNAIKFTSRGGVTITTNVEDDYVMMRVEDTGIGISGDFLPYVFDAFHQESTGFARTHEGVGLGLAITKRLVDLLEGTIEVTSRKDAGTTFIVRIPRGEELLGEELEALKSIAQD